MRERVWASSLPVWVVVVLLAEEEDDDAAEVADCADFEVEGEVDVDINSD